MATTNINIPSQILTYADITSFPVTGISNTIYIAEDTQISYFWNGSYNPIFYPVTNGLFAQISNSNPITGTSVETSLVDGGVGSLTVPENYFKVGDSFSVKMGGHISIANNQTLQLKIKSGAVILADTGAIPMAQTSNRHWELSIVFTIRSIGSTGIASIASFGQFTYSKNTNQFEGTDFSIVNNSTFDTTISNTLDITAQWSSNNATNNIYSESMVLTKIY